MFKRLLILPYFLLVLASFTTQAVEISTHSQIEKPKLQIAILAYRDKLSTAQRWQPLLSYLQNEIPTHTFSLNIYYHLELEKAVEKQQVDFVLTHPSHYVLLTHRNGLSSPLASLINQEGATPTDQFGGVAFALANRNDINQWKDLKNKTIAAIATTSTGAYQMQAFELLQRGIRLPDDANVIEMGQPQSLAVNAVLNQQADVGFVRTGVLESLSDSGYFDMQQIKIINATHPSNFPFVTSTRLYPEWPFAAMPHVNKDVTRRVAATLLAIESGSDLAQSMQISGFTIPGDYRIFDEMMRQLRMKPFAQTQYFDLRDVMQRWWFELGLVSSLTISILLFFIVLLLIRNRTIKQAKHTIEQSMQKIRQLSLVVEQSPEGIMITDTQGRIEYMNPAYETITGYTLNELSGKNPSVLRSLDTPKIIFKQMWDNLSQGKHWRGEIINKRKSGEIYPSDNIISPVKNSKGQTSHFLAIHKDTSTIKNHQQRIQSLLYFDQVTGLPNRTQLIETMDKLLNQKSSLGAVAGLILINVDHFKLINEIHGSYSGDALLKAMAERLSDFVKDSGFVARSGGDEFAVLSYRAEHIVDCESCIIGLEQTLLEEIEKPYIIGGERFAITCSIGASFLGREEAEQVSEDILTLTISHANTALKQVKESGGHGWKLFHKNMSEIARHQHQIESELRLAIERNQLKLFLQPQVNSRGEFIGAEALVRWQHPEKGLLSPGEFIAIAERTDLIIELGHWVLNQACLEIDKAQQQGLSISISVNISPRHFRQANFVDEIKTLLNRHPLTSCRLVLEITEGLFIENIEEVSSKINPLKKLGLEFSIDDFGTGYSSLSYLQQLEIDELKIDRSFIETLEKTAVTDSLVETIYTVANKMHLRVVAEGVETEHQVQQLQKLGELIYQGYYYGKPDEADHWLERWK
ncbi:EAL domain-containing protein [Thiomicrospira pelophila]|uniref:EAL domain-containing protein n=1 Tax=Thiomicrospira pelophila TaxID=934 RepID=UPI00068D581D|nr:EAL domain-containing protein [Thiomicrospira pelophila]